MIQEREEIKNRLVLIDSLLTGLTDNRCIVLEHEVNTIQEIQRLLSRSLLKNFEEETKRTVSYKTRQVLKDAS